MEITRPCIVEFEGKRWYVDRADEPKVLTFHEIKEIIADFQSAYQHILIFEHPKYGRVLVLDGYPQIAENESAEYTEALVGPALMAHPNPKRILILGGGDGDALRLILNDGRVEEAILADIDEAVVKLTQNHIPSLWGDAQNDKRVRIMTRLEDGRPADALEFLKLNFNSFDVIISDLTDFDEGTAAAHLESPEFIQELRRNLKPGGILAIQGGEVTKYVNAGHNRLRLLLKSHFPYLHSYLMPYVEWFSAGWSGIIASHEPLPNFSNQTVAQKLFYNRGRYLGFKYLQPDVLCSLFALPPEIRRKISV